MTIHCASILDWAAAYDGPLFHAALMDAPYEMEFMGKGWDNSGVAFDPETWRLIARCLMPGAFLFVMAGTLNDDLISVSMRQAGLRKYHKTVYWGYGSGFPKATNIAANVDAQAFRAWLKEHTTEAATLKQARAEYRKARQEHRDSRGIAAELRTLELTYKAMAGLSPVVTGTKKHQPKFAAAELGYREKDNGFNSRDRETFDLHAPATEMAARWLGHRYGGQMIKPAVETVLIFQKPYAGSPLSNITSTGAGALWIDGARIASGDDTARKPSAIVETPARFGYSPDGMGGGGHEAGRWPANLILSHSPACNGTCAPGCPVAALGAQSGEIHGRTTSGPVNMGTFGGTVQGGTEWRDNGSIRGHDDTGTAARFFYQADYMAERLELADAIAYVAKASRAEREAGLDPRQTAIMRLLDDDSDFDEIEEHIVYTGDRHTVARCPEHDQPRHRETSQRHTYMCGCQMQRRAQFDSTTVDDGRETPIDNPYQRGETTRRNTHPTIKPLSLCKYLAQLLLPPAHYAPRRLLVPFSGAGSEVCGADLAGWEEVTGVELEADHVAISEARRAYWRQMKYKITEASASVNTKTTPAAPRGQLDMFVDELAR